MDVVTIRNHLRLKSSVLSVMHQQEPYLKALLVIQDIILVKDVVVGTRCQNRFNLPVVEECRTDEKFIQLEYYGNHFSNLIS